jgi:hypothetical protein
MFIWIAIHFLIHNPLQKSILAKKNISEINIVTANEQSILEASLLSKQIELNNIKQKITEIKSSFERNMSTILNQPNIFLTSQVSNNFADFSLKTIQKYGGRLTKIAPKESIKESSDSLILSEIDIWFQSDFKNTLYILNDIENSTFAPLVRSISIKNIDNEVKIRFILYGVDK